MARKKEGNTREKKSTYEESCENIIEKVMEARRESQEAKSGK